MKKLLLGLFTIVLSYTMVSAQVINVSGEITTNTTWTNNNIYLLNGFVYVEDGAELTIEPGTLIKGDKDSKGSLIITRTGKIHATGTACEPIVFTSNNAPGSRAAGDWGGVIILGNAIINVPGGSSVIEGGVDNAEHDGDYGGVNDADNSGEFQYVRIEFPGIPFLPNNEINGLTMGGVGNGTQIDHVQVSFSGDDSYEWFGGNVNAKYLVAFSGLDDDYDTDLGYTGKVQFGAAIRDPNIADISGSNGFESDNDATGSANTPITRALFSNMTLIGPKFTTSTIINSNFKRGAHLRRNTECSVYNSIITGYPEAGLDIDGAGTSLNALADNLQFKNNILSGHGTNTECISCDPSFNISTYVSSNNNTFFADNSSDGLVNAFTTVNPDLTPTALSIANFAGTYFSGLLTDPFFTSTTYVGAFATGDDWTKSWVNWDPQNTDYSTPHINYNPVVTGVPTNATCPNTGSIDISVSGGNPPYTYSWSNGATTQDVAGLAPNTYTVTVIGSGCSTTATFTVNDVNIPKPTGLSVTETTQCSAKLNWNAVAGAAGYEVRYAVTGNPFSTPVSVGAALNYTFTGLLPTTSYDFEVRAKCATAEKSGWAKKTAPTVACGTPLNITASAITSSSALISWTDPCATNNYQLQYRKTGTTAWSNANTTSMSKTITGLLASTSYDYRVRTKCGPSSASPYSAVQVFTTLPMRLQGDVIVDANILNIYPNPATDNVTITIEGISSVNMSIVNMMGQQVYNINNFEVNGLNILSIDVSKFDAGIYLINVEGSNVKVSKELVITK